MTANQGMAQVTSNADLQRRWSASMMHNYGVPPLALVRGEGCYVWDAEGNRYLDLLAGIATSSLGHAHPAIASAVAEQARELIHTSNLYIHPIGLALAERLLAIVGRPGRVFFAQDGATANEAALKLARKHARLNTPDGSRVRFVAAEGSFHGRTMGALSVTGNPPKRAPFEPLVEPVDFVPYGDAQALAAIVGPQTAAVILEPVLGEGGVVVPPADYLAQARRICDEHGALLIVDEVQSGIGRTGHWFASLAHGVVPDVITSAKGLAGGMPLGAVIALGPAGEAFSPGDHGTTFGGNPVSCAAALAVLNTIAEQDLLKSVRQVGAHLRQGLAGIDHPLFAGHRGLGLWIGLELAQPCAPAIEVACRNQGYLVNALRPDLVRLAPPLILTTEQADAFLADLPEILTTAGANE